MYYYNIDDFMEGTEEEEYVVTEETVGCCGDKDCDCDKDDCCSD